MLSNVNLLATVAFSLLESLIKTTKGGILGVDKGLTGQIILLDNAMCGKERQMYWLKATFEQYRRYQRPNIYVAG